MSQGRLLARNSAVNLIGLVVPMIVAVFTIPFLVRGLGAERFGILTLAWAAIGYFGLFELGLSRALTQRAAQHVGNGEAGELGAVAGSGIALLLILGTLGGVVVALLTPTLVTKALAVPPPLQNETLLSFYVLAASLPFVTTCAGLRGLMEAQQHFPAVTALRLPMVVFTFLGPLAVLPFSHSLVPAVIVLAAGRVVSLALHAGYCHRRYPAIRDALAVTREQCAALLRFGGWTTVSNIISPMMVYLDRFVIGGLLTIAAVAHYVTPHELVTRLLVIPGSILGAMFPAFAAVAADGGGARLTHLYGRALRAVLLVMFPIVLVIVGLAREGLSLWVGPVLPPESAIVLQILAIGVFVNSLAQAPYAALQSAAKPELIAGLHVVELPLYLLALYALIRSFGVVGVAMAWTLRVTLDAAALAWMARRALGLQSAVARFSGRAWPLAVALLAFGAAAAPTALAWRFGIVTAILVIYVPVAWRMLLHAPERVALRGWLQSPRTFVGASDELA